MAVYNNNQVTGYYKFDVPVQTCSLDSDCKTYFKGMASTGSCCQYFRIYTHDYSNLALTTLQDYKQAEMPSVTGAASHFCVNNYQQAYASSSSGNKQNYNGIVVHLYCDSLKAI